jgi:hypothetical protein
MRYIDAHVHIGQFGGWANVAITADELVRLMDEFEVSRSVICAIDNESVAQAVKTYPDRLRPRVLALLASMWILPGLVAPPFAALIASTIGWRYAFVAPLPVIVAAWLLTAPSLHLVPAGDREVARLPARWPLQLMAGAAIVVTSLTVPSVWSVAAVAAGLAIAVPALRRIVPPGTFRAAPGIPATAAAAFLLSFGFLAVDAFATLMLTRVRGLSLGLASVAITTATVTWAVGAAWQSGRAERVPLSQLLRIGVSLVLVGELLEFATLFTQVPVAAGFAGWALLGIGMGISFSTIPLAAMRASPVGDEGTQVSSVLLLDMLGVATGAGVGGGIVAIAHARGYELAVGIAGSFAVGIAGVVLLLVLAGRLPSGPWPTDGE